MKLLRLALCSLGLGALVSTAALPQAQVPPMLPQTAVSPTGPLMSTPFASLNVLDPQFGAKGDGVTDDWSAIQHAEGMNSSGVCTYTAPTLVVVPQTAVNKYVISQAIRRCPNVVLWIPNNDTEIDCAGNASGTDYTGAVNTNQFPTFGCLLSGLITSNLATPAFPITGSLIVGQTSVTLTTAGNTSQLVVGDIVDVETTATWSPAGTEPANLKAAKVSALPGAGVVTLDRPVDFSSSSVQLRKLTNGAGTGGWPTFSNTNIPIFASSGSQVIGGRWVTTSVAPWFQPFDGGGGCLDCLTDIDFVNAGTGPGYGNLYQNSVFKVKRENIYGTPFEMAYQSNGNTTEIGHIQAAGWTAARPPPGWDVAFDEGSHDNRVRITEIEDYNGDINANWQLGGTVTGGGGDVLSTTLLAPAVLTSVVNTGGSGYPHSALGTMTWAGSNCLVNPVLQVTTDGSGVINGVSSIITPGQCIVIPPSSATTWTSGGGITGGSGATFTLTGTPSTTVSYTTAPGDTLSLAATGIAAAFNANSTFTGAGFTATANSPGSTGNVVVTNSSPGIYFTMTGAGANSITAYFPTHSVVAIFSAYRNKVEIASIVGSAITGYPVSFAGGVTSNEPATVDNEVVVTESNLLFQNGDVSIAGAGDLRNTIRDGWFHGPTFQPKVLWMQSGIGGSNQIARVKSDSPSGYPWCDQNDFSNRLTDIYAPLTMPRTTGSYNRVEAFNFCNTERVSSAAIARFMSMRSDFQAGNVTSSTALTIFSPTVAGAIEIGDTWHVRSHLNLSGSAGAKAGNISWECVSINWSIPLDATGVADVDGDCEHWGQDSTYCTVKIISNAAVAPAPITGSSSCGFGSPFGGGFGVNTTTSGDSVQPFAITFSPWAPTYSPPAVRP